MMRKRNLVLIVAAAFVVGILGGIGAYAATSYGTSSDPLVTLSYLNDKLKPDILTQMETDINTAVQELEDAVDDAISQGGVPVAESYKFVTLAAGQSLTGYAGTEIMLRSGSAASQSLASALCDSSGGNAFAGGALTQNHMYIVVADSCVVGADSAAGLLVRGGYSLS